MHYKLFSVHNGWKSKTIGLFLYRFGCTSSSVDAFKDIKYFCGSNRTA